MMGTSKRGVKQKARVEGSICSDYIGREITYFCSHYFQNCDLAGTSAPRNDPGPCNDGAQLTLSILNKHGRPGFKPTVDYLHGQVWNSVHVHILINCVEVKPYLD